MAEARARIDRAVTLAASYGARLAPQADAGVNVTRQRYSRDGMFPPPIAGAWSRRPTSPRALAMNSTCGPRPRRVRRGARAGAGGRSRCLCRAAAARLRRARALMPSSAQFRPIRGRAGQPPAAPGHVRSHPAARHCRPRLAGRFEQAEGSIPAARQRIAEIAEEIALRHNLLAALLGKGPDRGLAITRPQLRQQPIALPSDLPADLLGRRPDVVAQRSAWNRRATTSTPPAQFYPNVNLNALVGLQSISFAELLNARSEDPSFGPALRLPLFDGGRLPPISPRRTPDYDLAVEQYDQTLVDAMREVVDQLVSLRSVAAQRAELERGLAAARDAYALATERFAPASPAICRCSRRRRRCSSKEFSRECARARIELSIIPFAHWAAASRRAACGRVLMRRY